MFTVFITGGAGFIGSHLISSLSRSGARVYVYDRSVARCRRLKELALRNVEVVSGDVLKGHHLRSCMAAAAPDLVVHLAASHFIPLCEKQRVGTLRTNVLGTQQVIDATISVSPSVRFLFASSAAIYGAGREPFREECAIEPETLYGLSKQTGEELLRLSNLQSFLSVRLFNVIGPGDETPHLLPVILRAIRAKREVVLGNPDSVRDYVFVDDVVKAMLALINSDISGEAFNVGSGKATSVRTLVETVRAIVPSFSYRFSEAKLRKRDSAFVCANIDKISRVLPWRPQVDLVEGLRTCLVPCLA